ncbi:MAG: ANTAR domain-containing protein [Oscillospiraceae bacterium]|nr:ANTAR domain-containing protein [Oscillospiraceae bacterium]
MMFDGREYSILLVSASERFASGFRRLLPEGLYHPVRVLPNAASARRALTDTRFDFVVINAPLPDDNGTRLATDVVSDKSCVCLLITDADSFEDANFKVLEHGVFTLARPVSVPILNTALNWMAAARERLRTQEKKALSLEEKMEEIRLINRAKWLLIENLKMTEEDAHHYIERQAMNRGITRREVAESILSTYR